MPATHRIDNDARLIITDWEGEAHDMEVIKAIRAYQNNIQNKPEYVYFNEVVNLTKITHIKLTTSGVKNIGSVASKTDKRDAKTKLAIIVSSKVAFGFARMYIAYREFSSQANKEIQVFRNEKEAYEWIKAKDLAA